MDILRFGDSLHSLWVNQNLKDLIESEGKFLINLFEIKEKIDKRLDLLGSTWLKLKEKELYENLSMANESLFTEFYQKYCSNKFPIGLMKEGLITQIMEDFDWDFDKSIFDDFAFVDEYVRLNLWRLIFDNIWKEDVLIMLDSSIWKNWDVLKLIKHLIWNFFDTKKEVIYNYLDESQDENFEYLMKSFDIDKEDLLNDFGDSYIEFVYEAVVNWLKDNMNADFETLVKIIDVVLLLFFEKEKILQWFSIFCGKIKEKNINDLGANKNIWLHNHGWLFNRTLSIFQSFWKSWNFDYAKMNIDEVESEAYRSLFLFLNRILKELNAGELMKFSESLQSYDENRIIDNAEQIFEKYRKPIFLCWKQYFLSELNKLLLQQSAFVVSSDDENSFLEEMSEKYPKAKKHVWSIWVQRKKQLKLDFVKNQNKLLEKMINAIVNDNSEFFWELNLQDLFLFVQLSKYFFDEEKLMMAEEFRKFYFDFIENKIKESHFKFIEKENREKQENILDTLNIEKIEEKKQDVPQKIYVPKKKQLPKWMFPQIIDYLNWRLNKKDLDDLERSLRNSWWKYKTKWFKKFWLDSWFFTILDQYWFECDDEINVERYEKPENDNWLSVWLDTTDGNTADLIDSPEIVKLKEIIQKINETAEIDQKVDYYVQAFEIFYDIKDREKFKMQMLDSIKYDNRILKWVDLVLYKILNGQKEEIKTSGMSKRKRYFRFDLWYNTWYRIVIQDQDWSSRRIIVDFVNHDTYSTNISFYLKAF